MRKPVWLTRQRVLITLLAVALIAPFSMTVWGQGDPDHKDQVRQFVRCMKTCNDLGLACRQNCSPQCDAIFPKPSPEFDACRAACVDSCDLQKVNCKAACQFEFKGVTPEIP